MIHSFQPGKSRGLALLASLACCLLSTVASAASHVVRQGDTLASISQYYRISLSSLKRANPGIDPFYLYPGQQLELSDGMGSLRSGELYYDGHNNYVEAGSSSGAYTVRSGDTLSRIASRYRTSPGSLAALNGISPASTLYAGQNLRVGSSSGGLSIPVDAYPSYAAVAVGSRSGTRAVAVGSSSRTSYTVRRGDTLSRIASRFSTTVSRLARLNGLSPRSTLRTGQRLRVEGRSVARAVPYHDGGGNRSYARGGSSSYRIKSGDTLTQIARRYGITVRSLAAANRLSTTARLQAGGTLLVPRR